MSLQELFHAVIKTIATDMWPPVPPGVLATMAADHEKIMDVIISETAEIKHSSLYDISRISNEFKWIRRSHAASDVINAPNLFHRTGYTNMSKIIVAYTLAKYNTVDGVSIEYPNLYDSGFAVYIHHEEKYYGQTANVKHHVVLKAMHGKIHDYRAKYIEPPTVDLLADLDVSDSAEEPTMPAPPPGTSTVFENDEMRIVITRKK